jgi:hypothetical protein
MANNPFNRVVLNPRERPLSSDINQAESEADRTLRTLLERVYVGRASDASDAAGAPLNGFIGDGFKIRPVSPLAMQVRVPAGMGFIYAPTDTLSSIGSVQGVDDLAAWKPLVLNADATLSVPAAPGAPNSRIDIIEVRYNRALADLANRDVLNTGTGRFEPVNVFKTLSWDMDGSTGVVAAPADSTATISLKTGIVGVTPVAPATTAGYIKISEILVGSAVTTLAADVIKDLRYLLFPSARWSVACQLVAPASGPLVCTLSNVQAPPGITVTGIAIGVAFATADIYIGAGALAATYLPTVCVSYIGVTPGLFAVASISSITKVTVNATLQALLQGSQASPPTKVAVGQELYCIGVSTFFGGTPPVVSTYQIAINGLVKA